MKEDADAKSHQLPFRQLILFPAGKETGRRRKSVPGRVVVSVFDSQGS